MKVAMRTTVDDLVRALRWSRGDLLDAVMARKADRAMPSVSSARAMLRREKLKKSNRRRAAAI